MNAEKGQTKAIADKRRSRRKSIIADERRYNRNFKPQRVSFRPVHVPMSHHHVVIGVYRRLHLAVSDF